MSNPGVHTLTLMREIVSHQLVGYSGISAASTDGAKPRLGPFKVVSSLLARVVVDLPH
jgi:hypothetical protein